ncbi:MAG: hypothetical protein ACK56F_24330, partial [bacterium]
MGGKLLWFYQGFFQLDLTCFSEQQTFSCKELGSKTKKVKTLNSREVCFAAVAEFRYRPKDSKIR